MISTAPGQGRSGPHRSGHPEPVDTLARDDGQAWEEDPGRQAGEQGHGVHPPARDHSAECGVGFIEMDRERVEPTRKGKDLCELHLDRAELHPVPPDVQILRVPGCFADQASKVTPATGGVVCVRHALAADRIGAVHRLCHAICVQSLGTEFPSQTTGFDTAKG